MPTSSNRLCPSCGTIVKGRCPTCHNGWATRPSLNYAVPYDRARWKKTRDQYLRDHPLCEWEQCEDLATEVDHKDGCNYATQRFDKQWLRSLCTKHHKQRTNAQSQTARTLNRGKGRSRH